MRKHIFSVLTGMVLVFAILVLANSTNAQKTREARGKRFTKSQVKEVIKRVETRVDNFVKNYDKALDDSRLNGTKREDWLMKRARDLEHATDELRREFDRSDRWIENKAEVRKCLNIASDIDKNMRNRKYGKKTEANWAKVRYEINTLADIYNLPKVGSSAY